MARAGEQVYGTCTIRFHGTSTLHGFSGTAAPQTFILHRTSNGERAAGGEGAAPGWSTTIKLPVASLDTGIGARNRNMRKMFEADKYPYIVATFAGVGPARDDLPASPELALSGHKLPFLLKIRATARKTPATIRSWQVDDHKASFDADFSVSLKEFGLTAPTALGFIHVHDKVDVHAHVVLNEAPPGSP